ncbi:MAG: class I SAM-dependent methyltransferase, partial [Methanomethylovorans sp.]|nr:class I SAM-dependent methyltransferase [Methanomethylovorans sp.]
MNFIEGIQYKLISKMGFKYYDEDKYLIQECLKHVTKKNPKVLDVGCGTGHHSLLFEKYGADVTAFDYDENVIEKAKEKKIKINSNVNFLIADGRYPEKYFTDKYDIIFMAGFSIFGIDLNKAVMKKYLNMLAKGGILVLVHNSNLTG